MPICFFVVRLQSLVASAVFKSWRFST